MRRLVALAHVFHQDRVVPVLDRLRHVYARRVQQRQRLVLVRQPRAVLEFLAEIGAHLDREQCPPVAHRLAPHPQHLAPLPVQRVVAQVAELRGR